jgi:hypothetical protein
MTKTETARLNAATATQQALAKHEAVFDGTNEATGVPALVKASGELDTLLGQTVENFKKQQANKTGASLLKAVCLAEAADLAFEVAESVRAAANEAGDVETAVKVSFSRAELTRGSDKAIQNRLETIHETASEAADDLDLDEEYGVDAAKLTMLAKKIEAFAKATPKPRARINAGSAATKALKKNLRQISTLLRERVDRLMTRFEVSHPEFYNEYKAARRIVQPGVTPEETAEEKKAA